MKKTFLRFLKLFGIALGGITTVVAGVVTYVAISGGFNKRYQPLQSMSFSQNVYYIDGDSTEVLLLPDDPLVTELDVAVYIQQGDQIIALPDLTLEDAEPITIGTPFLVSALKNTITIGEEEVEINVGGEAQLIAEQGMIITSCKIFVDVPVISFDLKSDLTTTLYPGDQFTVSLNSITPSNSLNPSTYSNLNIAREDKQIVYSSSDNTIATVDANGLVTVLKDGAFDINAYIITTYHNAENEPSEDDFEFIEDYIAAMDLIRVKSSLSFVANDIAIESMSVSKTTQNLNLFDSVSYTADGISLKLNPQAGSGFLSSDLDYRRTDIIAQAGYYVTAQQYEQDPTCILVNGQYIKLSENYLSVEKTNNSPITWRVRVLDYKSGTCCIVFALPEVKDSENNVISPLLMDYMPITINWTMISNVTLNTSRVDLNLQTLGENQVQEDVYDLSQTATILPSNASYSKVLFFTEAGQTVIMADENNVVNGFKLVAVTGEDDTITYEQQTIINLIYPLAVGQTTVWASVVKTDINGEILYNESDDYIFIYDGSGSANKIVVNVNEELILNSVTVVDSETGDPLSQDGSVTVLKDASANMVLSVNSISALLQAYNNGIDGRLTIVSSNEDIILLNINVIGDALDIELKANSEGSASVEIRLDGTVIYNLNCTVISDKVTAMVLTANDSTVFPEIDAATFSWKVADNQDFALNIEFTPDNATNQGVTLYTYAVPAGYESNPNGTYTFVEDTTVLEITNSEDYDYTKAIYNFKTAGKVLIRALSRDVQTDNLYSNFYLVTVTMPDINVVIHYPLGHTISNAGKTYEQVVSVDGINISLITQSASGAEGDKFTATIGESPVNSGLFKFRYKNGGTTSSSSGMIIDNNTKQIGLKGIPVIYYEEIEIYTDFGYVSPYTYNYCFVPDYQYTANYTSGAYETVYALQEIDLFGVSVPNVEYTNYTGLVNYYPAGYNSETGSNYRLSIAVDTAYEDFFVVNNGVISFTSLSQTINSVNVYIKDPLSNFFGVYTFKVLPIAEIQTRYTNPIVIGETTYDSYSATVGTIDLKDAGEPESNRNTLANWITGATIPSGATVTITDYMISSAGSEYDIVNSWHALELDGVQLLTVDSNGIVTITNTITGQVSFTISVSATITLQGGQQYTIATAYRINIYA